MYIKNQVFTDEDTLLEMIFDFSIGESSTFIDELRAGIDKELEANLAYQEYRATLNEEDRLELEQEERDIRLAEALMDRFKSFKVEKQKLYGISDTGSQLLFEINLV